MNPLITTRPEFFSLTEDANLLSGPALMMMLKGTTLHQLSTAIGDVTNHGARQVCVSGYSCALPWNAEQAPQPPGPEELRFMFGRKQGVKWREMTNGSFFWTWLPYRNSQGVGPKGWGFKEMVDCDNVVPPEEFIARRRDIQGNVQGAKARMEAMRKRACKAHDRWCENRGMYEWGHWRFEVRQSAHFPMSTFNVLISPSLPYCFLEPETLSPFLDFAAYRRMELRYQLLTL